MIWMILSAGCSDMATVTVEIQNQDEVGIIEVIDQAVWKGSIPNGEGYYDSQEAPTLPTVFTIPAGEYTVVASQGTCNQTKDISVALREQVTVELELVCNW